MTDSAENAGKLRASEPDRILVARWLWLQSDAERVALHRQGSHRQGSEVPTPAELALSAVLQRLPPAFPGAGFAERVLARVRPRPAGRRVAAPGAWMAHWGARAAVALVAVQAGLLLAAAIAVTKPLLGSLDPARAIGLAAAGLAQGLEWLVQVPRLGVGLARLGEGVAQSVAGSPALVSVLALCLISSATGLYLLSALVPGSDSRSRELGRVGELHGS